MCWKVSEESVQTISQPWSPRKYPSSLSTAMFRRGGSAASCALCGDLSRYGHTSFTVLSGARSTEAERRRRACWCAADRENRQRPLPSRPCAVGRLTAPEDPCCHTTWPRSITRRLAVPARPSSKKSQNRGGRKSADLASVAVTLRADIRVAPRSTRTDTGRTRTHPGSCTSTGTDSTPTTSPSAGGCRPSDHRAHNATPRGHDALPPDTIVPVASRTLVLSACWVANRRNLPIVPQVPYSTSV